MMQVLSDQSDWRLMLAERGRSHRRRSRSRQRSQPHESPSGGPERDSSSFALPARHSNATASPR
eukprot:1103627-Pleurochrysis_carterae.AAC.3